MHSSIKLDSPCEFINITPINPLISKCEIKVCYVGDEPNRNKSIITKEVARKMANSLPGSPIVGFYNEETQDFEEHNRIIEIVNGTFRIKDNTRPYGFVDLNAKCWFQKFLDDGVNEHEYLMTTGYLWTEQYPECQRIIKCGNNQSMQLDENSIDAYWTKDENNQPKFFIINEALIANLCILGEDYEPCFEGASISQTSFSYDNDFKEKLDSMISDLQNLFSKGGAVMVENETNAVDEMTSTENVADVDNSDSSVSYKKKKTVDKCGQGKTKNFENSAEDVEEESDSDNQEDEEETDKEKDNKKKKKYNLEEIQEYVELTQNYSALETKCNNIITENEQLKQEISALTEFKNKIERKEKQAMIDSFYMLSDADKDDVIKNIDTYSLDDIEAKLSVICVRNKVSFDLNSQDNKSNITTFNLSNINTDSTPAWIKSALETAKTIN